MAASAHLRPWRLLPAYAINGISVALGVGCIQLVFGIAAGSHTAQLVISGAVCASLADVPNTVARTWHRVSAAAALSFCAALAVSLLKPYPPALGAGIALIAFIAMMTMAWGARAGAVSFAPILSLIFSMAVPTSGPPLAVAGWNACGGLAYLAWSLAAGALCQRRYRTLVLVETLHAAAQLFRSRAGMLETMRPDAGDALPMRAWIKGETTLAERLQSARNLLFAAADGARWRRDTAILLRVVDLRDVLLVNRLDIDLLGGDATGRSMLDHVAGALRQIGYQLDCAADEFRDGIAPIADTGPRFDFELLFADVPMAPHDPRARLLPALLGRLRQLADDVVRIHRLLHGHQEALPLTRAQLQLFIDTEGWPLRALRLQLRHDSPVLRHAVRTGLALGCAYFLALALPWASHPYWLVLSVAVVLRGSLEQTLARRNARVLGTMLGCVLVMGLANVQSPAFLSAVFLAAVGVAHAFVMQRYWVTATSATVLALLQSHMVNPGAGFFIAERVADTLLGALLAWSFSYVLPSWERRGLPRTITRVLRDLQDYATHALALRLQPGGAVELRLARRRAYDSLGSLADALQRSSVEPRSVRLPVTEVATLLDHGERLMAHLLMVRLILARLNTEQHAAAVDSALAEAQLALSACLDLRAPAARQDNGPGPAALALLPAEPPEHDLMPWLARRLLLMVHEADRIRHAAASALADRVAHGGQRRR